MKACAKLILFGEHSVIYGSKCMALPLLNLELSVSVKNEYIKENDYIKHIKKMLNITDKYFKVHSNIPYSSGLGSSASLVVAISKLMNVDNIYSFSKEAENYVHGKSSGIDVAVISKEKGIIFENGDIIEYIQNKIGCYILVTHSNEGSNTKNAVQMVRDMNRKDLMDKLIRDNNKGIEAFIKKDVYAVANNMKKVHNTLKEYKLSTSNIEEIIKISSYYDLASKITGSGMGGCVVSLLKDKKSAKKLKKKLYKKGYKDTWIISV